MSDFIEEEQSALANEERCKDCNHSLLFSAGDHDEYCRICDCSDHGVKRFEQLERQHSIESIQHCLDTGFFTDEINITWAHEEIERLSKIGN